LNPLSRIGITVVYTMALACISTAATILNPSFEQPTTASFVYNPVDPTGGWTFSGRSGVAVNTFFTPPPPDGNQAAFIQQYVDQPSTLSMISQSLTGVALAPSSLTFRMAQRPGYAADPFTVLYGSQNLGTFTPLSTAFTQVTINFTPAAASGALVFQSAATTNSDLDSAIDSVGFNNAGSVPEPSSALLVLPVLALLAQARRRRAQAR